MRFLPAAVLAAAIILPAMPLRADEPEKAAAPAFDSAAFRTALPGSWKLDKRQGPFWSSEVKIFRDDGTFSSAVAYDLGQGVQKLTYDGVWTLDGSRFSCETRQSSDPASEPAGNKTTATISSFSDKEFRYIATNNPAPRIEKRADAGQPAEPPATLGYSTESTGFYQAPPILSPRLKDSQISAYVEAVEAECHRFFSSVGEPLNFQIITAFRPGKKSRVWIEPASAVSTEWKPLIQRLEAVEAMDVKGPVGLVIFGRLAGGNSSESPAELPMPAEWKAAMKSEDASSAFDEMLDEVWPDTNPSKAAGEQAAPQQQKEPESVEEKKGE